MAGRTVGRLDGDLAAGHAGRRGPAEVAEEAAVCSDRRQVESDAVVPGKCQVCQFLPPISGRWWRKAENQICHYLQASPIDRK